jgi:hypothetical protein
MMSMYLGISFSLFQAPDEPLYSRRRTTHGRIDIPAKKLADQPFHVVGSGSAAGFTRCTI